MRISADQVILDKYDLTIEEFMVLYLNAKEVDIKELMENLIKKGLAAKNLFDDNKLVISNNTKSLISTISIDSDNNIIDKDEEFNALAKEMKEIYPKGVKSGTSYLWRGTTAEVAKKLKTLVMKYHFKLNKEEVLNATKEYVNSFNGDYRYMHLLKYFILKAATDADGNVEIKSELMSLIENKDQVENQREDWISTLQ